MWVVIVRDWSRGNRRKKVTNSRVVVPSINFSAFSHREVATFGILALASRLISRSDPAAYGDPCLSSESSFSPL